MKKKVLITLLILVLLFTAVYLLASVLKVPKETTGNIENRENTEQILKNHTFLNSVDGIKYQEAAWNFAKAFLNGDMNYIKKNSLENAVLEDYNYRNEFASIKSMIYRINKYDEEKHMVSGEYIINRDGSCIYLEFVMALDKNKWKIKDYSVDA